MTTPPPVPAPEVLAVARERATRLVLRRRESALRSARLAASVAVPLPLATR